MKRKRSLLEKADAWYNAQASRPIMAALRHGLTYMLPFLMAGSLVNILRALPIPAYQDFLASSAGRALGSFLDLVYNGSMGLFSVALILCVSTAYAADTFSIESNASPIVAGVTSLGCFFVLTGLNAGTLPALGLRGLYPAVFTAMVSPVLFRYLASVRGLRLRSLARSGNPIFNTAITLSPPAVLTLAFFCALKLLVTRVLGVPGLQAGASAGLARLLGSVNSPVWKSLLYVFFSQLLWFFGINGSAVLEDAAGALFGPGASSAVLSRSFFDAFVLIGGGGALLCLILDLLLTRRKSRVAKLAFLPALFNSNELAFFGLPVLLNPLYSIPFIGVPLLLTLTTWGAVSLGLIPRELQPVDPAVPVVISGYIASGSLGGSLLQMFNLALGALCYLPFARYAQRAQLQWRQNDIDQLIAQFRYSERRGEKTALLVRQDSVGNLARSLLADLERDLDAGAVELHYQPIVDRDGRVDSVEVLLRWKHRDYGYIYPPLVIALAEEADLIGRLGNWIMDEACRSAMVLRKVGFSNIPFCVNVSAAQLKEPDFMPGLWTALDKYALPPSAVEIEVTERLALTDSWTVNQRITEMISLGFNLVMDDFGAGHSSLMYLKEYTFSKIKLDGSLIQEILTNPSCREIVRSIIALGRELDYSVIAEYVETEEQRDMLLTLGCDRFQGYLYSRPVPFSELYDYIVQSEKRLTELPTLCLSALRLSQEDGDLPVSGDVPVKEDSPPAEDALTE